MPIKSEILFKSEIERKSTKIKKSIKHLWCARDCIKIYLGLNHKKERNVYNLGPLNFFKKSILVHKFICAIFQSMIKEKEGLLDFSNKRESCCSVHFRSSK
jgi:hypothetical protein